MDAYEGKTARTVPPVERKAPPGDGEVIVSVVRGVRPVQISIHPKFLVPWGLVGGSDVVVINGPWFGIAGTIVGEENGSYIVKFTPVDEPQEDHFGPKQLANLEPLRNAK